MVDRFRKIISAVSDVPADETKILLDIAHPQEIREGDYFLHEGDIPDRFAFVSSGLFRYFYIDKKGNDCTKGFFPEDTIISSYSAMIQNRGSHFSIKALEDSVVLVIHNSDWVRLRRERPVWNLFLIAILEKGYGVKESREREFLLSDARERYLTFLKTFPGMEDRIPQHLIASYIGITPVALSRIRKKMRVVNPG
ncbi:MAG TPA: Crp/Fnr family transcriptional regulator [Spirochaetota bacterium]